MNYPNHWNELVRGEAATDVHMARAFRPSRGDCFQFTDSQGEHLAVRSLTPYGETESLAPDIQAALLPTETREEDYTVLKVPRSVLTLRQASFGNGREHVADIRDSYRRVGNLAGRLVEEVATPSLSLSDFGIDKRSGKLILLPPLELGRGKQDRPAQVEKIAASISKTFRSLLPPSVCLDLIEEVRSGFGETQ